MLNNFVRQDSITDNVKGSWKEIQKDVKDIKSYQWDQ